MSRRSQTGRIQRHPATSVEPRSLATALPRSLRLVTFAALALLVAGVAIALVVSRLQGPGGTDATAVAVHASMGGFDPSALTVKAGTPVRIELSSMDTSMHSDGGGWHQFAIDDLGVNFKVGPLSSEVFEFTAPAKPGTYTWYCDICCGGKENPSMRGTLSVAA
jgi:heme/copper-type cytochrome/quinol oxidase subunit 2